MLKTLKTATRLHWLATALVALALSTGCGAPPIGVDNDLLKGEHFLAHNLKFEQDGAIRVGYRANYLSHPQVVSHGSQVQITFYSSQHIDLLVDGIPFKMYNLGAPFPTDETGIVRFLEKHFVRDPQELDSIQVSDSSTASIARGMPAQGMTKEEVILTIGYPSMVDNEIPAFELTREEILNSNQWIYPYSSILLIPFRWILQFNSSGTLTNVIQ